MERSLSDIARLRAMNAAWQRSLLSKASVPRQSTELRKMLRKLMWSSQLTGPGGGESQPVQRSVIARPWLGNPGSVLVASATWLQ